MASTAPITLHAAAAESASGAGPSIDLGVSTTARLTLAVTAASGTTPMLDVVIETSDDSSTWVTLGSFTQVTAAGVQKGIPFPGASRYVRARWTLGGTTPGFTFSIAGISVLVYATPADLAFYGAPDAVLSQLSSADMDRYLTGATDVANGELQNHHQLPLKQWADDLRGYVSAIAIWAIMSSRIGFNPENGSDIAFKMNRDAAMLALKRVGIGEIELADVVDSSDSSVSVDDGGAFIYSDAPRGWDR